MNFIFDNNLDCFLKIILKTAQNQNLKLYFVGGIVRDYFLRKKTTDIDLLIVGNAIDFAKSLPKEITLKSIHEDFCTAKVEYKNLQIDIASTRIENYPYSGCLPVVTKTGVELKEDVSRRDFKINSMYFELGLKNDKITYELIDLVNGQKDLKDKILSVLHKKSYIDDPTRILRGIGFKYRFGFDFSQEDKTLIEEYLNNIDYSNMSFDRCFQVFKKTLLNKYSNEIFKEIIEKKYYKILFNHNSDIDFKKIDKIINKFNLKNENLVNFYLKILENKNVERQSPTTYYEISKTFENYSNEDLAYYFYKTNDENIETYLKFENQKLLISGEDLINLNYPKGKLFGEIMSNLLNEKLKNKILNNKILSKEEEINWVLNQFPQKEK